MLTLDRAKALLETTTTQEHLLLHAKNVSVAMGGMAAYFGENKEHWMAIGSSMTMTMSSIPRNICSTQRKNCWLRA